MRAAGIAATHTFVWVAVESLGPLSHETSSEFLTDLGRRPSVITDDTRETFHSFSARFHPAL